MTIIDRYLPEYTINEVHSVIVPSSIQHVYQIVRSFQFANTMLTNLLFSLRGFSTSSVHLQTVLDAGFIFLGEEENKEFVLGLAGKFWTPSGCLQRLSKHEFTEFSADGYAKAVWNFSFEQISDTETNVRTETRVLCLDDVSRRRFKIYWFFVRPFSGLIRKEILRSISLAIKNESR